MGTEGLLQGTIWTVDVDKLPKKLQEMLNRGDVLHKEVIVT